MSEIVANWWLIKTLIWIDVALIAFVAWILLSKFPKRVRRRIRKNIRRLDGSVSSKRRLTEHRELTRFLTSSMGFLVVALLLANAVIYVLHCQVLPIPIASAALQQFDWHPLQWEANLQDPAKGYVAGEYQVWANSKGINASEDLVSVLTTWPFVVLAVGIGLIGVVISLVRFFLASLVAFERQVQFRYRIYFAHDMRSRIAAVEGLVPPNDNKTTRRGSKSR